MRFFTAILIGIVSSSVGEDIAEILAIKEPWKKLIINMTLVSILFTIFFAIS